MPKISIIEKEQIKAAPLSITENIVFIPVFTKNESKAGKYTLYSSAAAFEADFKDYAVKLGALFDKSYVLARTVLDTGLKVLVYGVEPKMGDVSYESFQKIDTSITEDLDSTFKSGETKISNVKEYVEDSLKLYNGDTQVTTFIRTVTEDNTITSEQNTALQGDTGLILTLDQGKTYSNGSIKFYKTVEEQTVSSFVEVTPTEGSLSVVQNDTNLTIKASFEAGTIITRIEFITTANIDIELSVSDTGVITITNFSDTDTLPTINKLEYNIITPDLNTATTVMQAAYTQFYGQSEEDTLTNNYIGNRNLYDVKFLTGGGYATTDAIISAAVKRGDCLALLDKDEDVKVEDLISKDGEDPKVEFTGSKFAAAFFPWCTFELAGNIVGDDDSTSVYYDLPGSAAYLLAYGRSVQSNANWMAASGVTRGVVPSLVAPKEEITEGQMHYLQGDTGNIEGYVNPIMMVGSYGYKIWGNRTTYVDAATDTFFKFLNVRMLLCDINKILYTAAIRNTFEPNDDVTWINFKAMCSGVLDRMTSGRGLMWYRWQKEKSPQKATIKAKLIIRPIEAVETFELEIFLTEDEITVREAEEE